MELPSVHESVLLREAVEGLAVRPDGVYVDGTFGRGGHAAAILAGLGPAGRLLAIDKDPEALAWGGQRFGGDPRVHLAKGSFAEIEALVGAEPDLAVGRVDGVLFDLGVSSPQLDDADRGFSFLRDGPLDMRMDPTQGPSARDWIATATVEEMARVIEEYGEERFARRIARAIDVARAEAPILTTRRLAALVEQAVPTREKGKHPATRTFQALRIEVNGELADLETGLAGALKVLAPRGRLAVIAFHSLEDRLVKRFIRDHSRPPALPKWVPVLPEGYHSPLRALGRAIHPSDAEVAANPRARSAVLRLAERNA